MTWPKCLSRAHDLKTRKTINEVNRLLLLLLLVLVLVLLLLYIYIKKET